MSLTECGTLVSTLTSRLLTTLSFRNCIDLRSQQAILVRKKTEDLADSSATVCGGSRSMNNEQTKVELIVTEEMEGRGMLILRARK
jgi:hypothetical protein